MAISPKPTILELDFGMGNIRSLQKAFEYLGQPVRVCNQADEIKSADAILLPGDGAFGTAMKEIKSRGFYNEIKNHYEQNKPILGVCIGFQILFSGSTEFGQQKGFNFLEGEFDKIKTKFPVPHIGWSKTKILEGSRLLLDIPNDSYFYYVHSYGLKKTKVKDIDNTWITGECTYGEKFISVVEKNNLFGVQFHPEKSQEVGLKLLKNFLKIF